MRVLFALLTAIVLGFPGVSQAADTPASSSAYDKLSQEAERNKELLEIWKEHVRTLTKERDEAYRQLDALKADLPARSSGTVARFGGVETQPLPAGSPPAVSGPDAGGLRSQLQALEAQNQSMKRELEEAKNDKNVLIREKAQALDQVQTLSNQARASKQTGGNQQSQAADAQIQNADAFRTKSERLAVVEKELADTRSYLNATINDLQSQNKALVSERDSLKQKLGDLGAGSKSQGQKLEAAFRERDAAEKQIDDLRAAVNSLKAQLRKSGQAERDLEAAQSQLESLQSSSEALKAENDKLKLSTQDNGGELERLRTEKESIQKMYSDLNYSVKQRETDLDNALKEIDALKQENEKLTGENESLRNSAASSQRDRDDFRAVQRKAQDLNRAYSDLRDKFQAQQAQLEKFSGLEDEYSQEIASLKEQLQMTKADHERTTNAEHDLDKALAENDALRKANAELENRWDSQDAKFRDMSDRFEGLERENTQLRATAADHAKVVDDMKEALRANYSDMQNLKMNLESYLDSLVSSFEERQR